MFILKSPIEGYNGTSFGVRFIDGEGKTEDRYLASRMKAKGYTLIEPEVEEPEVDLESMEYKDLRELAKEVGVKGNLPQEEMVEAIAKALEE